MTRCKPSSWVLLLGGMALVLAGCGDEAQNPPGGPPIQNPLHGGWITEVIYDNGTKLGGCAVGELLPDRPGLEAVAVDVDGRVHLVFRDGDGWGHELLADLPGEMIQCAIGDCTAAYPGNEIAVVGMAKGTEDDGGAGAVHVFGRTEAGWAHEKVGPEFPALVHGVAVTDMDESGLKEIVAVGFDEKATVLQALADGTWSVAHDTEIQGPGKSAIGYGTGAAIAVAGGHVAILQHHSHSADGQVGIGGWTSYALAEGPSQARIHSDGTRILVAGDDGGLRLIREKGGGEAPDVAVIHQETQKLRGAALGDFDPTHEGLEAASAGYEGKVVVLTLADGTWTPTVVYEDGQRLHHLASGDVLPDVAGDELVTCGYSGKLVLIRRR